MRVSVSEWGGQLLKGDAGWKSHRSSGKMVVLVLIPEAPEYGWDARGVGTSKKVRGKGRN